MKTDLTRFEGEREFKIIADCNRAIVHAQEEHALLTEICNIIIYTGEYRLAWVGIAEDDEAQSVLPTAHAGYEDGYLAQIKVSWGKNPLGQGPAGIAIRTKRPSVCNNIRKDPAFAPWRDEAEKRGFGSVIALPLTHQENTFGALVIAAAEPEGFSARECELLEQLGQDLAHGIKHFREQEAHRVAVANLQASEQRFRLLAENIDQVFWFLEFDPLKYVYISPGFQQMWGVSADEVYENPHTWEKSIHPDDYQRVLFIRETGFADQDNRNYAINYRIIRPDGEVRWVRDHIMEIWDDSGRLSAASGIIEDITEKKKAEDELQGQRRFLQTIIDHLPVPLLAKSGRPEEFGRFVLWNKMAEEIFGVPREDALGKTDYDIFPHDQADFFTQKDRETYETGEILDIPEEPLQSQGHGELWLHTIKVPIYDMYNNPEYMLCISEDLTEQKLAREALEESEERYRLMAENATDMISRHAPAGRYLYASPAAMRLLGYEPDEMIGRSSFEFVHRDDKMIIRDAHLALLRGDSNRTVLYRIRRKDDAYIWFETTSRSIRNLNTGEITEIISVSRDVTARKLAEEENRELTNQMQHAQKLESLGILAGGIAHDFNNLLTGIIGNTSLALMECPSESPLYCYLNDIERTGIQMSELTRQMLAYSGRGTFTVRTVDLNQLVREMTELMKASIKKKANLELDLHSAPVCIDADTTQVQQILMNLIINASEAIGSKPGDIIINTGFVETTEEDFREVHWRNELEPGTFVFFQVEDTGAGMDPDTLERLFEPFFTTKFTGRGLGLATVQGIMRSHKGAILVSSKVGVGTCFRIMFPASKNAAEDTTDKNTRDNILQGEGLILVVDDEERVRDIAARGLEKMGFSVVKAADGQDGIEIYAARQHEIVAVLLDLTMPGLDGVQVFRELKVINPDVQVVLASGYSEIEATGRFDDEGLAGFLSKPFSFQKMQATLQPIVESTNGS